MEGIFLPPSQNPRKACFGCVSSMKFSSEIEMKPLRLSKMWSILKGQLTGSPHFNKSMGWKKMMWLMKILFERGGVFQLFLMFLRVYKPFPVEKFKLFWKVTDLQREWDNGPRSQGGKKGRRGCDVRQGKWTSVTWPQTWATKGRHWPWTENSHAPSAEVLIPMADLD